MKKRTTTHQLQQAIKDNLLKLIKAEKYNKSTYQIEVISIDLFKDSLDFLCESLFDDCIGWYYETPLYNFLKKITHKTLSDV